MKENSSALKNELSNCNKALKHRKYRLKIKDTKIKSLHTALFHYMETFWKNWKFGESKIIGDYEGMVGGGQNM